MRFGFSRKSSFVPVGEFDLYTFKGDLCRCPACKRLANDFKLALTYNNRTLVVVCSNCNQAFRLKNKRIKGVRRDKQR